MSFFTFTRWLAECQARTQKNEQGGLVPQDLGRAKASDLITLPPTVEGTNCGNCRFYKAEAGQGVGDCEHPEVRQHVNPRMCCRWWDNPGVKRPWVRPHDG